MTSRTPQKHPHLREVPSQGGSAVAGPEVTLAAIEALYAFAEEPAKWEDLIQALEALPGQLDPSADAAAAQLSTHANRAAELAKGLNDARRKRSAATAPWDAVLLSAEGRVRETIGAAETRLAPFLTAAIVSGAPLALRAEARNAFHAAFDGLANAPSKTLLPLSLMDPDDPSRLFGILIARNAFPPELCEAFDLGDIWAEPLYAVVLLSQHEGKPIAELAQAALGLTQAEAKLAAKMATGAQISDAAESLGISPHTARTQLKAIFAKTGARRQSELIGILGRVAAFGGAPAPEFVRAVRQTPSRRFVTMPGGRRVFYREYGHSQGAPVLYFHVGLSGSLLLNDLPEAARKGVRLFAFERPGYGQSTPAADFSFERVTQDAVELIRQLKLGKASLLGDGTGGAFALHAALTQGEHIRKIALRAPRLIQPKGDGGSFQSAMSTIMRQPWLIKSIVDILRRGAQIPLLRAMADRWVPRSAQDRDRFSDEKKISAFQAAMVDALEVSSEGFAAEMKLFQTLPRWDMAALNVPVSMWIGAENPVISVKETSALIAEAKDAKIRIVPDTGIDFSALIWDEIVDWLK